MNYVVSLPLPKVEVPLRRLDIIWLYDSVVDDFCSEYDAGYYARLYMIACYYLDYVPETGKLYWKNAPAGANVAIGQEAGSVYTTNGYLYVRLATRAFRSHRLIWLMQTREWPLGKIDHINMIKTDNRWANLRLVTDSGSSANRPKPKNNTSGYKGVRKTPNGKNWRANVQNYKAHWLGTTPTKTDAAILYDLAAMKLFKAFARTNFDWIEGVPWENGEIVPTNLALPLWPFPAT